jgi:hypothetical protein
MADLNESPVNPFAGIFWQNNPNVNKELRQKITLAMMLQKRSAPKTFGEGLTALGEGFADRMAMKRLENADVADQDRGAAVLDKYATPPGGAVAPPPAAAASSYAPPADVEATPAAPAAPAAPANPAPTALTDMPLANNSGGLTNTPTAQQPADTLFNPKSVMPPPGPGGGPAPPPAGPFDRNRIASAAMQRDVRPGAIRNQGDYNEIDAQAGMRPTPGYIQDSIARQTEDPDMRAYLGSLSAGEAKNAQDVSPTGAAGPFQFTRGTGRQYGLMGAGGDQRADLDASASAALDLTQDNINAFRKINGREPTMADLALMHQQGGVTGARMIGGTGNAPPGNLAVNNVPAGASPAAATARIKNYYGMPERTIADTGRTTWAPGDANVTDPRDPARPPVMAFDGSPTPAQAPAQSLVPPGGQVIRSAPPAPQQVAQAGPEAAVPGYIMRAPDAPKPRQQIPPSDRERKLTADLYNPRTSDYAKPGLEALLKEEINKRVFQQGVIDKTHETETKNYHDLILKREDQRKDAAKNIVDVKKTDIDTQKARVEEINGKKVIWDENAKIYRQPVIEGVGTDDAPTGKLNEAQGKTVKFLRQQYLMSEQLKGKDHILSEGWKAELAGKVPFAGNAMMERNYKMAKRAAEFWVAANLRDISGATIGSKEHSDQMKYLMPGIGDDAQEIKRKAAARQAVMDGMKQSLGDQQEHATYAYKQVQKGIKEEQENIANEMKDTPRDGKIYKNPANPKQRRMWDLNDKVWREL